MGILRRTVVMLLVAGIVSSAAEAFAKGPRVVLNARLVPVAGAPATAKGKSKFDQSASRTNFSVEAENLRGLNGQSASIFVNGALVGSSPIALGRLKLELTNERGGTVPAVTRGTQVVVMVGTTRILAGAF